MHKPTVTDAQIRQLRAQAFAIDDYQLASICEVALGLWLHLLPDQDKARAECARRLALRTQGGR